MKTLFIFSILIVTSCVPKDSINNSINELNYDSSKNYMFDEYVSELLLINKSKLFPNINDIPK